MPLTDCVCFQQKRSVNTNLLLPWCQVWHTCAFQGTVCQGCQVFPNPPEDCDGLRQCLLRFPGEAKASRPAGTVGLLVHCFQAHNPHTFHSPAALAAQALPAHGMLC